jgi:hypothetical protein
MMRHYSGDWYQVASNSMKNFRDITVNLLKENNKNVLKGNLRNASFFLISIAVLYIFLSNWSLLDGMPRNSFAKMLDGSADKPFVYRQLLPLLVNHIEPAIPEALSGILADNIAPLFHRQFAERLINRFKYDEPGLRYRATQDWSQKSYRVKYVLAVIIMFASLWGTLNILANITTTVGASDAARLIGPIVYASLLPLSFLNGGYYYDFIEQLLISLLILSVLKGHWLWWALAAIAGQFNKETMLLLPFFLIPLIAEKIGLIRTIMLTSVTSAICFFLYIAVKTVFDSNPGSVMEYNLSSNLAFWSDPTSYTRLADMYAIGFPLPRASFWLVVIGVIIYGVRVPRPVLLTNCIALATLIPMFFIFGYYDEFRGLAPAFPLLYLVAVSPQYRKK